MVKVASFTRYVMRTDRMAQPNYKMLVQALRPEEGYVMVNGTEEDVPLEAVDTTVATIRRRRPASVHLASAGHAKSSLGT